METNTEYKSPELLDPKYACAFCKKKFKTADKLVIESVTENRYHANHCWNNGKNRKPPTFFGLYQEKDAKVSSVDRARIQTRLKKIRRQVKKRNATFKVKPVEAKPL